MLIPLSKNLVEQNSQCLDREMTLPPLARPSAASYRQDQSLLNHFVCGKRSGHENKRDFFAV
jgi:hypothetical protein